MPALRPRTRTNALDWSCRHHNPKAEWRLVHFAPVQIGTHNTQFLNSLSSWGIRSKFGRRNFGAAWAPASAPAVVTGAVTLPSVGAGPVAPASFMTCSRRAQAARAISEHLLADKAQCDQYMSLAARDRAHPNDRACARFAAILRRVLPSSEILKEAVPSWTWRSPTRRNARSHHLRVNLRTEGSNLGPIISADD